MPDNLLLESQLNECRKVALLEARRRGLDHAAAEDIGSETVISLLSVVAAGKQINNVGGWSRVTAARIILHRYRDNNRAKRGGGKLCSLSELTEAGFEV